MLKIRLQRVGRKHDPSYRVVATNSRTGPKSNKHVELLGHYDAIRKTKTFEVDAIKAWIAKGAQLSDTVHNLLVKEGVIDAKTVNPLPLKTAIVKEPTEEELAAAKAEEEAKNAPAEDSASEETAVVEEPAAEESAAVEEEKKEEA